jgi:hypothetical protein
MTAYRPGLPPVPPRLQRLPIHRGYPVPWFVAQVDGVYDFRIVDGTKFAPAVQEQRCWICGQRLGSYKAFTIGPMCVINRVTSEPPSHTECAEWAIQACPFLNQREQRRNEANLPDAITQPAGEHIDRQPGVAVLWITKSYRPFRVENGSLFRIGPPERVAWFREGRLALRGECDEAITSGYPILLQAAEEDGPAAVGELEQLRERALALLPSA